MTCIVGLVEDGRVFIGGDSAVTTGYVVQTLVAKKVFRHRDCLCGYSGSVRMLNLLEHTFAMPEHPSDMSIERYLTTRFVDAVRVALKDAGNAVKSNEYETSTGSFLVGYSGRLFTIANDYAVTEMVEPFTAIGNGNEVALGALHATRTLLLSPRTRITLALEAASTFCNGVHGPFHIEVLEAR